jgi:hypothetical protein
MPQRAQPDEYETVEMPWRAVRAQKSAYFARTGIPPAP